MQNKTLHAWQDPLSYAQSITDSHWVFLHSGAHIGTLARYSIIAQGLKQHVTGNDFSDLEPHLTSNLGKWENMWFGYFGYNLKNTLESLPEDTQYPLSVPKISFMKFNTITVFDHIDKTVTQYSSEPIKPNIPVAKDTTQDLEILTISSNMSQQEYLQHVEAILEKIQDGEIYQANLTRKFMGEFINTPNGFNVFKRLHEASPAPYSCYLKMGDTQVISSSPELFLDISRSGSIKTSPIKGTAPRSAKLFNSETLATSIKDQSENLMIVDLMRNDLARCSVPGSVKTPKLYEVTPHNAVFHMSSTVTAQKEDGKTCLDVIKATFPPGSMTGAPKIRAMHTCSLIEKLERGIYSGAIGWLGGNGSAQLSVVIRTIIIKDKLFEFQVGGGIVADSKPISELKETVHKAQGILSCLGLSSEIFYDN